MSRPVHRKILIRIFFLALFCFSCESKEERMAYIAQLDQELERGFSRHQSLWMLKEAPPAFTFFDTSSLTGSLHQREDETAVLLKKANRQRIEEARQIYRSHETDRALMAKDLENAIKIIGQSEGPGSTDYLRQSTLDLLKAFLEVTNNEYKQVTELYIAENRDQWRYDSLSGIIRNKMEPKFAVYKRERLSFYKFSFRDLYSCGNQTLDGVRKRGW